MKDSLYLSMTIDGKQIGLYKTSEQALAVQGANRADIWDLDEKTGQYHPTIHSIGKLELLPRKGDVEVE